MFMSCFWPSTLFICISVLDAIIHFLDGRVLLLLSLLFLSFLHIVPLMNLTFMPRVFLLVESQSVEDNKLNISFIYAHIYLCAFVFLNVSVKILQYSSLKKLKCTQTDRRY